MILLDTHTWIWSHSATKLLSGNVKKLIKKTQTDQRAIASISIWEFAMMTSRGRIQLSISPDEWINYAVNKTGLRVLELSGETAVESCNLPGNFHNDPADRIIVATARIHKATLISKDQKIIDYPEVNSIW